MNATRSISYSMFIRNYALVKNWIAEGRIINICEGPEIIGKIVPPNYPVSEEIALKQKYEPKSKLKVEPKPVEFAPVPKNVEHQKLMSDWKKYLAEYTKANGPPDNVPELYRQFATAQNPD